ncbi:MAG: anti-sigma factor [Actinomycetota bacterium]
MTDHRPFDDLPDEPLTDAELAALDALLGDEAVWEEPTPGLEDAVVAAIGQEMRGANMAPIIGLDPVDRPAPTPGLAPLDRSRGPAEPESDTVVPFETRTRRWVGPLLGAAAALLLVAGFSLGNRLLTDDGEVPPDHLVALAGTELEPEASAVVDVLATPLGTRLILDVTDLPPAPEGQYYEAWLRQSPEIGVSAGTFHLRGGDGAIELWAGVTVDDYPLITVTIQEEGAGAASSGRVVLAGRVDG